MNRLLSKRNLLALGILLASIFLAAYFGTQPRLAPGQAPLADIDSIETLRTQFNHDKGQMRLIILVSPT
jgi:hypothetical protein